MSKKTPIVDIPALSERVKEISKTYKVPNKPKERNRDGSENLLRGIVGGLVINAIAQDPDYWKRADIRMVPASEFEDCLSKVRKNAKVLGQGEFGKFVSVRSDSCIKGLPAGLNTVGIKTEYIKHYYHPNQSPEAVQDAFKIAKKAAELGIGPELYDLFVTKDTKEKVIIVKVSKIIDGKTWADTEWETPEQRHAAAEQIKTAIQKLNEAGIIHHDLHSGNVMVDKAGRVYIIDYDLAKFAKDEEYTKIHNFNESYPSEYDAVGVASDDGIQYVYDKLVEEGSIKETEGLKGGKRRSKTRKHYIR